MNEDAYCLAEGHSHATREEEAVCSLRFQLKKLAERWYERRCVNCKYARVTVAHPDDHPLAARTYCGNDDSPAFDRNISFAGDDTCGHWQKGRPEHDADHMPMSDERPSREWRLSRRDNKPDRRKCGNESCLCHELSNRRAE